MFPKPSILPKPSFVLFSFSVYFCQQRKASSLSLPQSQSSLVLKQTKLKARCKTNPLCLSPAHLSLYAVSHFFFTRSGGQWVSDYISSSFFFFFSWQIARSDTPCERSWLGRPLNPCSVFKTGRFDRSSRGSRKKWYFRFCYFNNRFDEQFTVNPVGPYGPVQI